MWPFRRRHREYLPVGFTKVQDPKTGVRFEIVMGTDRSKAFTYAVWSTRTGKVRHDLTWGQALKVYKEMGGVSL